MIGAALNSHAERNGQIVIIDGEEREQRVLQWLQSHQHEAEWLASVGSSPTEARMLHKEWLDRTEADIGGMSHVGLTPN